MPETAKPIMILRPQPGAGATARRLRAAGLMCVSAPLFRIVPRHWQLPDAQIGTGDAVLWTSANAVRMAQLANPLAFQLLSRLPGLCVGTATARMARRYRFAVTHVGDRGIACLLSHPACAPYQRILWPSGTMRTEIANQRLFAMPCYDSVPTEKWRGVRHLDARPHIIIVHSTAAAQRLARIVPVMQRSLHIIVAISAAVATATGTGWHTVHAPQQPDDASILALCRDLCQKYDHENG